MKRIILQIIEFLEDVVFSFKTAYDETWGCSDLAEEFEDEVELRKAINKEEFIGFTAGLFIHNAHKKGMYLSENEAKFLAEKKFEDGVTKGYFDELNKIKGENNERK